MPQISSKKVKTLGRLIAAGYDSERHIQALTVNEMLAIEGVTVQEMQIICELQNAVRAHSVLEFLADSGAKPKEKVSPTPHENEGVSHDEG